MFEPMRSLEDNKWGTDCDPVRAVRKDHQLQEDSTACQTIRRGSTGAINLVDQNMSLRLPRDLQGKEAWMVKGNPWKERVQVDGSEGIGGYGDPDGRGNTAGENSTGGSENAAGDELNDSSENTAANQNTDSSKNTARDEMPVGRDNPLVERIMMAMKMLLVIRILMAMKVLLCAEKWNWRGKCQGVWSYWWWSDGGSDEILSGIDNAGDMKNGGGVKITTVELYECANETYQAYHRFSGSLQIFPHGL